MKTCPACGSDRVHPSRPRSTFERLKRIFTARQPYRCHVCEFRGWAPLPVPRQGLDPKPSDLRSGTRPPPITGADLDRLDRS
jgi:hypothetical protein